MLSSDEEAFGGFENLSKKYDTEFVSTAGDYDNRPHSLQVLFHHPVRCFWPFGHPVRPENMHR